MAGFAQLFRVAAKETAEETREEIIATARREHARVMQAEPRPSRFIRTVDGVRGASEEAVRADGRIEYVYPRLEEVVRFALETLFDYPGLGTPTDSEAVRFVQSLTGANGTFKVAFGTEGGLFSERLGVPTVICGPGHMAQGHRPDEFVTEEQMARCDAMMDALLGRLEAGL